MINRLARWNASFVRVGSEARLCSFYTISIQQTASAPPESGSGIANAVAVLRRRAGAALLPSPPTPPKGYGGKEGVEAARTGIPSPVAGAPPVGMCIVPNLRTVSSQGCIRARLTCLVKPGSRPDRDWSLRHIAVIPQQGLQRLVR